MPVDGVSHYVKGETCALTCFSGYKYFNARRTERLCNCKNGDCYWKFSSRAYCVADESLLRHFNILDNFNSLTSSVEQIAFLESRLGDKQDEVSEFQRSKAKPRPMGQRKPALGGARGKKQNQPERMQRRRPSSTKINTRSFMQVNLPVKINHF